MQESKTRSLIGRADKFLYLEKVDCNMFFDSYILCCFRKFLSLNINNSRWKHLPDTIE